LIEFFKSDLQYEVDRDASRQLALEATNQLKNTTKFITTKDIKRQPNIS